MENISTKKIAVQVFGNPDSNTGFSPLVNLNGLMPPLNDVSYPGVSLNPYFFVIRNDVSYTQYMLVHNRAKSYKSSRGGILNIAIGIPSGTVIQGNVSPYKLMMNIFGIFSDVCMENQQSGDLMYKQFTQSLKEDINNRISDILKSYPLVDRVCPHRPMTATGQRALLSIQNDKLEQLFQDVQYAEFVPFSEIVVAAQADTTLYQGRVISNLQIPRRANFKIFVNKRLSSKTLSTDAVTISSCVDGGFDRNCYKEELLTLIPDDILSGKDMSGVKVDFAKEQIDITMNPPKKVAKLTINVEGCDSYSNIDVLIGNLTIHISDRLVVKLFEGDQIKVLLQNKNAIVRYTGQAYQALNTSPQITQKSEGEFVVNIGFRRINIQPQSNGSNLPAKTNNDPILVIDLKGFNRNDYDTKKVYEDALSKKEERNYIRLSISCGQSKYEGYKKYIVNAELKEKDRREFIAVKLPSDFSNKHCNITMPDWKMEFKGIHIIDPKTDLKWSKSTPINEKKESKIPRWVVVTLIALIALCVGLFAGQFLLNGTADNTGSSNGEQTTKEEKPNPKPYDPVPQYKYYQDEFKKVDLSFATIHQCQKWINDTILKDNLQSKLNDFDLFKDKVDAYNNVVKTILEINSVDRLIEALEKTKQPDGTFKLSEQHVELSRKAYAGRKGTREQNNRINLYLKHHKTFKSFLDFKICDGISASTNTNTNTSTNTNTNNKATTQQQTPTIGDEFE